MLRFDSVYRVTGRNRSFQIFNEISHDRQREPCANCLLDFILIGSLVLVPSSRVNIFVHDIDGLALRRGNSVVFGVKRMEVGMKFTVFRY